MRTILSKLNIFNPRLTLVGSFGVKYHNIHLDSVAGGVACITNGDRIPPRQIASFQVKNLTNFVNNATIDLPFFRFMAWYFGYHKVRISENCLLYGRGHALKEFSEHLENMMYCGTYD